LQDKGRILVSMGQVDDGIALVDEAMVAAVAGELGPVATGKSYCNMLSVCGQVADYQRAAEWSDAAKAWCEGHSDSVYPGICRLFRAELKWLRGSWNDAVADIRQAIGDLNGFTPVIGAAHHYAGEFELRAGRLEQAAADFQAANQHGFTPLPGLAKLRLREGQAAEALDLMTDALRPEGLGPMARARLLPTWIDVQIALGAVAEAEEALEELEGVAETCRSTAMHSAAAQRRAVLSLSDGRVDDAVAELESARDGWTELKMPYEAAESRLLLAKALEAAGNEATARLELDSARSILEELGAADELEWIESTLLP
jgi:tetratricopeptide (TPR) repeat protein